MFVNALFMVNFIFNDCLMGSLDISRDYNEYKRFFLIKCHANGFLQKNFIIIKLLLAYILCICFFPKEYIFDNRFINFNYKISIFLDRVYGLIFSAKLSVTVRGEAEARKSFAKKVHPYKFLI